MNNSDSLMISGHELLPLAKVVVIVMISNQKLTPIAKIIIMISCMIVKISKKNSNDHLKTTIILMSTYVISNPKICLYPSPAPAKATRASTRRKRPGTPRALPTIKPNSPP